MSIDTRQPLSRPALKRVGKVFWESCYHLGLVSGSDWDEMTSEGELAFMEAASHVVQATVKELDRSAPAAVGRAA
jgi:hypothetical protein